MPASSHNPYLSRRHVLQEGLAHDRPGGLLVQVGDDDASVLLAKIGQVLRKAEYRSRVRWRNVGQRNAAAARRRSGTGLTVLDGGMGQKWQMVDAGMGQE